MRHQHLKEYSNFTMAEFIETAETKEAFAIPVYKVVVFPLIPMSIELDENIDIDALEKIHENGDCAVLLTCKNLNFDKILKKSDVYPTATAVFINQIVHLPDGKVRIMVIGSERVRFLGYSDSRDGYVRVMRKHIFCDVGAYKTTAALAEADRLVDEYIKYMPKETQHLREELSEIKDLGEYADHVAASIFWETEDRIKILDVFDPQERILTLLTMLREKIEILALQQKLKREVKRRVDKNQKEYYLNEQLKAIHSELGEETDAETEWKTYLDRIDSTALSDENKTKLIKEANKLKKVPFSSIEYGITCNYLDVCLDIPWDKTTRDRTDVKAAMAILNRDHDGLEKVKERIVEYLAVKQLSPSLGNQILCLVGPKSQQI